MTLILVSLILSSGWWLVRNRNTATRIGICVLIIMFLIGIVGTLALNLVTSVLFFASADLFINWYEGDNPLAWGDCRRRSS